MGPCHSSSGLLLYNHQVPGAFFRQKKALKVLESGIWTIIFVKIDARFLEVPGGNTCWPVSVTMRETRGEIDLKSKQTVTNDNPGCEPLRLLLQVLLVDFYHHCCDKDLCVRRHIGIGKFDSTSLSIERFHQCG